MSSQQNFGGNTTIEFISVAVSFGFSLVLFIFVCIICNRRLQSIGISVSAQGMLSSTGLSILEISMLPTFSYQIAIDHSDTGSSRSKDIDNSAECAICLTQLVQGEIVRLLPNCKHVFHIQCIDMWLCTHPTCPVCRTDVKPGTEAKTLEHEEIPV